MAAGPLTSNHVNYLIWRYLQESGHGSVAARLQKAWGIDPETLPFARHIRTHALIQLVQKGLQYHEIEKSLDQYGNRRSPSPSMLFFGPESAQRLPTPNGTLDGEEAKGEGDGSPQPRSSKVPRKNPQENGISYESEGRAVKRSRRSNGSTTNGNLNQAGGDNMEIDQNGYAANASTLTNNVQPNHGEATSRRATTGAGSDSPGQAIGNGPGPGAEAAGGGSSSSQAPVGAPAGSGSPTILGSGTNISASMAGSSTATAGDMMELDGEGEAAGDADDGALQTEASTVRTPTLTNGCSVGVQSDKVAELGPGTTVLSLPDKNVTHTAWNPCHPAVLAAGGHQLCRIWSFAYSSSSETGGPNAKTLAYTFKDLFEDMDTGPPSVITSMAWSPDGELLAIARYMPAPTALGTITTRTRAGELVDEYPGGQNMVYNLSWNALGTLILGITNTGEDESTLVVWDIETGRPMAPLRLTSAILDATWTDDRNFIVCGPDKISEYRIEGSIIESLRDHQDPDRKSLEWSKILFDPITRTIAAAAESTGDIAIIDSTAKYRSHRSRRDITAMVFQPLPNPAAYSQPSPRLLATSSSDGSITIWNAIKPWTMVWELSINGGLPALALSFSTDGHLVAAASYNKVLMWHPEHGGRPKAEWGGKDAQDAGWQLSRYNDDRYMNGIGDEEPSPTHSLGWDADGKMLAYGLNDQIAIINIRGLAKTERTWTALELIMSMPMPWP